MSLSKAQWMAIEEFLSIPFGHAKLKCDGFEITAQVRPLKGMRLVVAVFVNGHMKGAWLDGKDERCIKFYQKKTKHLLKADERKQALANSKNRYVNKVDRAFFKHHAEAMYEYWLPYWTSPRTFCRHIQKTCQSIEFIE